MGQESKDELLSNIYRTIFEPAKRLFGNQFSDVVRDRDAIQLMEVVNDALREPRVQRIASERIDAMIEINLKANTPPSKTSVNVVEDTKSKVANELEDNKKVDIAEEIQPVLVQQPKAKKRRGSQVQRQRNISYLVDELGDENVKFHNLSSEDRKALFADADQFLQAAALEAEQERARKAREKQRLKQAEFLKKKLEGQTAQQHKESTHIEEKPRKTLLTFKDDTPLRKQESNDTNYSDDEFYDDEFENEDEFESEDQVGENDGNNDGNNVASLMNEMERAKQTEKSINQQHQRLEDMEQALSELTGTNSDAEKKRSGSTNISSQDSGAFTKPGFGSKRSKKKKKYY